MATNFSGNESFGDLTVIEPSMCHMAHNSGTKCGSADNGGVQGFDNWLEANLPGIREDVGQDGVVLIVSDENQTNDNLGTTAPTFAAVIPGTTGGTPGILEACQQSSACYDASAVYDQSSVARAVIQFEGGTCSDFDNTVTYNAYTTAAGNCSAATALPIAIHTTP